LLFENQFYESVVNVSANELCVHENISGKIKRFEVASSLLIPNETEPFLGQIVMCDEKWLYDNRKRSGGWLDEDESPKHFPKPDLHQKKTMITVLWSMSGIIHYIFEA